MIIKSNPLLMEVYIYLPVLFVRMKITKIPVIARSLNYNYFGLV